MRGFRAIDSAAQKGGNSLHFLIPDKTTKSKVLGNNIESLDGCEQDAFKSSIYL